MSDGRDKAVSTTADGRYIIVRGRLWRRSDPALPAPERDRLVHALMDARRAVAAARRAGNASAERAAHAAVDAAKIALGERGPVWWDDGAPDYTRHLLANTPYAAGAAAAAREPSRAQPPGGGPD